MPFGPCEPRGAAPCSVSDRFGGTLLCTANVLTRKRGEARWHPVLHRPFTPTFDTKHAGCPWGTTLHVACAPRAGIEVSTTSDAGSSSGAVSQQHAETPSTSGHVSSPPVESRPAKLTRCTRDALLLVGLLIMHDFTGHGHGPAKRLTFMYCALMDCHAAERPSKV